MLHGLFIFPVITMHFDSSKFQNDSLANVKTLEFYFLHHSLCVRDMSN